MKLADVKLDTVYADREGRPLVVVSLETYYASKSRFHSTRIRPQESFDRSFGLVIVTRGFSAINTTNEQLLEAAARLREDMPRHEVLGGPVNVKVAPLSGIVRTWEEQLAEEERERQERARREERVNRVLADRRELIDRVESLLPDGVAIDAYPQSSVARIPLTDLLAILEGARS